MEGKMTWPKPPNDNGVGIHFGSVPMRYIEQYLPLLKELHIKWAVLCDESPDLIGHASTRLLQEGIMPVARPDTKIDAHPNFANKARWCKTPYIQVFNEPGDVREWDHGRPRESWAIFVEKWIAKAHQVRSVGYKPGLQVMNPDELRWMLLHMGARGEKDLWPDMWLALHLYPSHECFPACTEHEDDVLGFLRYAKVCEEIMGFIPPMVVTETAWTYGTAEDRARWMVNVYDWFKYGKIYYSRPNTEGILEDMPLPDYLFAFCPWILFGMMWYGFSWVQNPVYWPLMEAVKAMGEFTRYIPDAPPEEEQPPEEPPVDGWKEKYEAMLKERDALLKERDELLGVFGDVESLILPYIL